MDILTVIREFLHDRLGVDPGSHHARNHARRIEDRFADAGRTDLREEKFNVTFDRDTPTPATIGDMIGIVESFTVDAKANPAPPQSQRPNRTSP
jgi:hypothetical protein